MDFSRLHKNLFAPIPAYMPEAEAPPFILEKSEFSLRTLYHKQKCSFNRDRQAKPASETSKRIESNETASHQQEACLCSRSRLSGE